MTDCKQDGYSTPETLGPGTVLAGIEKYRRIFGSMHWQPAPLLVELVRSGRSIADWERSS